MELSRRNRLFHYKALKSGSLSLRADATDAIGQLLAGKKVHVVELATVVESRGPDAQLKQVRTIARKALENEEERGLSTLFVIIDQLTCTAEDRTETVSPLALLPVGAEVEGRDGLSVTLQQGRSGREPGAGACAGACVPRGSTARDRRRPGAARLVMTGVELFEKLVPLIPPTYVNLTRFHGVFAPTSRIRAQVVPRPSTTPTAQQITTPSASSPLPTSEETTPSSTPPP